MDSKKNITTGTRKASPGFLRRMNDLLKTPKGVTALFRCLGIYGIIAAVVALAFASSFMRAFFGDGAWAELDWHWQVGFVLVEMSLGALLPMVGFDFGMKAWATSDAGRARYFGYGAAMAVAGIAIMAAGIAASGGISQLTFNATFDGMMLVFFALILFLAGLRATRVWDATGPADNLPEPTTT